MIVADYKDIREFLVFILLVVKLWLKEDDG